MRTVFLAELIMIHASCRWWWIAGSGTSRRYSNAEPLNYSYLCRLGGHPILSGYYDDLVVPQGLTGKWCKAHEISKLGLTHRYH